MRGGYRHGAGRPSAGVKVKQEKSEDAFPIDAARASVMAKGSVMSPLDYMLTVMNNPKAAQSRRDRMACAAAPFCHPRMADNRFGKKDAQVEAALTAGQGSDWAGDLDFAGDGGKPN